jgi:hypothetical protein
LLPKPTKALQAREEDLGIEKNLGKTMVVNTAGKGPGAGFYVSGRGGDRVLDSGLLADQILL